MRLSLRTLLAFEDNIFDAEQHRQLERIIPRHDAAAMTLCRIRTVVRNPHLGVPGIVDQREELDPNYVAEYLDHQMNQELQERFEAHSLSSDKYLAEIASVHQILSGVLGEPARTSRECRLRCYDLYRNDAEYLRFGGEFTAQASPDSFSSPPQRFSTETEKNWDPLESLQAFERESLSPVGQGRPSVELETRRPIAVYREPEVDPEEFRSPVLRVERPEVHADSPEPASKPTFKPTFWSRLRTMFGSTETASETKTEAAAPSDGTPKPEEKPQNQPQGEKRKSLWSALFLLLLLLGLLGLLTNLTPLREKLAPLVAKLSPEKEKPSDQTVSEAENVPLAPPTPQRLPVKKPKESLPKPSRVEPKVDPPQNEPFSNHQPPSWAIASPERRVEIPKPAPKALPPVEAPEIQPETILAAEPAERTPAPVESFPVEPAAPTPSEALSPFEVASVLPEPATPPESAASTDVAPAPFPVEPNVPVLAETNETPVDPFLLAASALPEPSVPSESASTEPLPPAEPFALPAAVVPFRLAGGQTNESTWSPVEDSAFEPAAEVGFEATAAEPTPPENPRAANPLRRVALSEAIEQDEEPAVLAFIPASEPSAFPPVSAPDDLLPATPVASLTAIPEAPQEDIFLAAVASEASADIEAASEDSPVALRVAETSPRRTTFRTEPEFQTSEGRIRQPDSSQAFGIEATPAPKPPAGETVPAALAIERVPVVASVMPPPVIIPVATPGRAEPLPPSEPARLKDGSLGTVSPNQEPCVLFSAGSSSEQWKKENLPLKLLPDQYLLSVAPYRVVLELHGVGTLEMIGDTKICLLAPDANGIPGIYIDYGRLILRPAFQPGETGRFRSLRVSTENAEGIVSMSAPGNLVFIDTFAEIVPSAPTVEATDLPDARKTPRINPILGFLAAAEAPILWSSPTRNEPLVADRHTSIILEAGQSEFGVIRHLPSWLQRQPLSIYGREMSAACERIFRENGGYSEAALHAMVDDSNVQVRAFGFRLWGDLGRFDVPLKILGQMDKDDEPIRQSLVPYFREVMKRDEETVQRLSDAVEMVRR